MARSPDALLLDTVTLDPAELLRFAVVARIDALTDGDGQRMTRSAVAYEIGESDQSVFTNHLRPNKLAGRSGQDFVKRLQLYLSVRDPGLALDGELSLRRDLVSFRSSLVELRWEMTSSISVPAAYFVPLARRVPSGVAQADLPLRPAETYEELHLRTAALVALREQASDDPDSTEPQDLFALVNGAPPTAPGSGSGGPVDQAVDEIVRAACLPHPASTVTLGLAAQLEDWVLPVVHAHLMRSPIGWRAARIITRSMRLYGRGADPEIQGILREAARRPGRERIELDLARAFLEEAIRRSPHYGQDEGRWAWRWVPEHFASVARDSAMPWRLRMFAIHCLSERSETEDDARKLLGEIAQEADPSGGIAHVSTVLGRLLDADLREFEPDSNGRRRPLWPWLNTPAFHYAKMYLQLPENLENCIFTPSNDELSEADTEAIDDRRRETRRMLAAAQAATPLDDENPLSVLPETVRSCAQILVLHALLSPDVTERRLAADTLAAAGAAGPAAEVISNIANGEKCEDFLKEIAAVVLGYIGHPAAAPSLAKLALYPKDPGVARTALMAIAELSPLRRDEAELIWEPIHRTLRISTSTKTMTVAAAIYATAVRFLSDRWVPDDVAAELQRLSERANAETKSKRANSANSELIRGLAQWANDIVNGNKDAAAAIAPPVILSTSIS